jgi:ABC transport system ATP-binding/permease protein
MPLLNLRNITLSVGGPPLLAEASLTIELGDKIALIGRNGVGKSTFLKLLSGTIPLDNGQMDSVKQLTVATLDQSAEKTITGTLLEVVLSGFGEAGQAVIHYQRCLDKTLEDFDNDEAAAALQEAQHAVDIAHAWGYQQQSERVLSQLNLDPTQRFEALSGGTKRRTLIAKAIVTEPDLLLLDEPTNHLDIEAIAQLEKFLVNYNKTFILITHDRHLLQQVCNRIVEIDSARLFSWTGHYEDYLVYREAELAAEETANRLFDKRLAEEERWIRQGVKARRTRNEGRVRALKKMREEHQARRKQIGTAKIQTQSSIDSGKIVIEAKDISFSYQDRLIIPTFSTVIQRGDKIGILGPNGCGKTTIIKLLLGDLTPTSGSVRHGTKLQIAYFDQHQTILDENKTIFDNIGDNGDHIMFNGQSMHVLSYLKDFLFTPERARSSIKVLSGGERNRLLLAKLFSKPNNVIVLDEPTNDLDIETLELLEEVLMNYTGTLIIVSHDRTFLNQVVTSTIAFDKGPTICEYVGGYDDYLNQRPTTTSPTSSDKPTKSASASQTAPAKERKNLSYKEQKELDELPKKIEKLEQEIEACHTLFASADFYQQDPAAITKHQTHLKNLEETLAAAYARWAILDK